jgi:hypothetical protein
MKYARYQTQGKVLKEMPFKPIVETWLATSLSRPAADRPHITPLPAFPRA